MGRSSTVHGGSSHSRVMVTSARIKIPRKSTWTHHALYLVDDTNNVELPSKSVFVPIRPYPITLTSSGTSPRGNTPSTRGSDRLFDDGDKTPAVASLEDLSNSKSYIGEDDEAEDDRENRPPCRSQDSNPRLSFSEYQSKPSVVIHSSIPIIGDWIRGSCIGEGSQGNVFEGSSVSTGFEFAVKCLRGEELVSGGFDRLSQEARTELDNMSSLNHPHIIQCYGAEIVDGHLFIFMEFCPHGSLAKYVEQRRRLTEADSVSIVRQLLDAVHYLHSRRTRPMMHRDIKAANILISSDIPGLGVGVKLCDFGSSTRQLREDESKDRRLRQISPTAADVIPQTSATVSADTTDMKKLLSSTIKGTCNWIAPEVLKGEPYSVACDVWSVGCTVIEMLTGSLPWRIFDNPLAGMFNIMTSLETPVEFIEDDIRNGLTPDCLDFLHHCLDRDPNRRWSAKRLLKHPWIRVSLGAIPATPAGFTPVDPSLDYPERAII